jgi:hypothetical protein
MYCVYVCIYIYIYVCVCTHKWTVEWENHLVDFYGHVWLPEGTLNEGTPDCNPPDISLIVPQDFQPSFRRSACNGLAANQKKLIPRYEILPRIPDSVVDLHVGGRMGVHISEKGFRYQLSATCSRASPISIVPGVLRVGNLCVCVFYLDLADYM